MRRLKAYSMYQYDGAEKKIKTFELINTNELPDESQKEIESVPSLNSTIVVSDSASSLDVNSMLLHALKIVTIPMFAALSSLSLPMFIILIEQRYHSEENSTLVQKILQPLVPYLTLVAFRTWFLWNLIGHRLNGQHDADISQVNESSEDAPWHVLAALIANTSSFTHALLLAFIIFPKNNPALLWSGTLTLATFNYTTDLVTDVVDAFRKHVEQKQLQGLTIKPFFKQAYVHVLFQNHIEKYGLFLREALPMISGIIRSQVATQSMSAMIEPYVSQTGVKLINVPLGLATYSATAYFANYELIQLRDNLEAASHKTFKIENQLSQSSVRAFRVIGKIQNGQMFIDLLKKLKFSIKTSVNITFIFAAIGLMTLLQNALHEYVSSTNFAAVEAGEEGLVMSYYFGKEKAIEYAPSIEIGVGCIAVSLGVLGVFARAPTLHKYAKNTDSHLLPNHVAATNNDTAIEEHHAGK